MKTGLLRSWKLVIIMAGLPLVDGNLSGPGFIATAEETAPTDIASAVLENQPAPQPAVPTPPDVKLSPGAAEIAKLAQAGLGEDVMLAFVGNVNSTFNLGSDQIVYLNDLGVSETVVKAMIQRDAKYTSDAQAWAAANQPPAAPIPAAPVPADDGSYASAPTDNPNMVNPGDMTDYVSSGDAQTTDDTGYFYDSLAPYGSWITVVGIGRCWQPTVCVANHGWQPYFDRGRWMYTDCGWYWRSDYSWGWAAFHYGRWFNDEHRGWCWKPDHVWAPAWVSWRHSADYCGWAPLPPSAHFIPGVGFRHHGQTVSSDHDFGLRASHYTFIPVGRMTDYSPFRYAASSSQAADLYHQTTAANHFTFEHNRVVSRGIDPKQVALASGIEVRTAQIRETPGHPNTNVRSEHLAKQGDSLMIFRPQLSPPAATVRPRQFFAPPSRTSGTPKTSSNNSAPNSAGSQAVLSAAQVPRAPAPLPVMNFAASASGSRGAKTEFNPSGSMVVVGEKSGSHSQPAATGHLPNMNFAHQPVQSQPATTYAAVPSHTTYEPSHHNDRVDFGTRPTSPAAPAFNGYRQQVTSHQDPAAPQFNPGQSHTVIPSHFTVASRSEGHSAYTVYGGTSSEPALPHHSSSSTGEVAPMHHSAPVETHAAPAQHFAEHSAPAPAAVSHSSSSSTSSSSASGSGHR